MKNNLLLSTAACRLDVRATERATFTEYHITAVIEGVATAGDAAAALFAKIAVALTANAIQPIQEKLYGFARVRTELLKVRDQVYRAHGLDRTMPATWIEGEPLLGCDFAGVQIWGVTSRDAECAVTTVESPATGRARLWTGRGFRMLHVPAVRGVTAAGELAGDPPAQAQQMFENASRALAEHGMAYGDVVRTWIYVAHLLDWYGDLNRVRTAFYKQAGFGGPGGRAFPASTGIMGRCDDEACQMDVLALTSTTPAARAIPIVRSPRQDSSFNYGSAFSRGMTLDIDGRKTVHVSGTASINPAGESVHVGDAEMQSIETLLCIAAILEEQGGGLANITSATVFCQNRAAWDAWCRVTRLLQIPSFPHICVIADVCRRDLLVEMETVATI